MSACMHRDELIEGGRRTGDRARSRDPAATTSFDTAGFFVRGGIVYGIGGEGAVGSGNGREIRRTQLSRQHWRGCTCAHMQRTARKLSMTRRTAFHHAPAPPGWSLQPAACRGLPGKCWRERNPREPLPANPGAHGDTTLETAPSFPRFVPTGARIHNESTAPWHARPDGAFGAGVPVPVRASEVSAAAGPRRKRSGRGWGAGRRKEERSCPRTLAVVTLRVVRGDAAALLQGSQGHEGIIVQPRNPSLCRSSAAKLHWKSLDRPPTTA